MIIWEDLERNISEVIIFLFWHFSGGTKENFVKP
jgi:hypothetical protein